MSIATIRYLTTASFGFGASALLGEALAEHGITRPMVVTDPGVRPIAERVAGDGVTWFDRAPANPTEAAVLEARDVFRAEGCDGLVAIGGGRSVYRPTGVASPSTLRAP